MIGNGGDPLESGGGIGTRSPLLTIADLFVYLSVWVCVSLVVRLCPVSSGPKSEFECPPGHPFREGKRNFSTK